jgi:hypothetical protein
VTSTIPIMSSRFPRPDEPSRYFVQREAKRKHNAT